MFSLSDFQVSFALNEKNGIVGFFFLFFPWTTYRTLSKFDFETKKMRTMKTYNFFTKGHYIFETYFKLSSQTNSVWFSTILVKLTSSISYYNVFLILSWISTLLWKLPCWLQLLKLIRESKCNEWILSI